MTLPAPFEEWGEHVAISLPGVRAVFTTRRGGFSTGPYESLNLGRLTDDAGDAVQRNRARVGELVQRPLAMVHQVHGAKVWPAETLSGWPNLTKGDGVFASGPELAPSVLVADCLPVAVAARGAVAMLHAGWRGLSEGILAAGVAAVRERVGADTAVQAAIGPGIGVCCYEVGEEVHEVFAADGPEVRRGANLDLAAVARAQLSRWGVEDVYDVGLCTACHPELFFSHRRDHGVTGRQAGIAWLS
jgi:YfiH family protein